ncbi:MAG: helix-turn-helix transcriptional regulator [Ruminococcaceae bacterium]|nr:helix-turn-helix transcriptional regulator [Oscillospiraceae bacterium]
MTNNIIHDIEKYIEFLKLKGYTVSLSTFGDRFTPITSELINFDIHPHAVCNYLKANPATKGKCVRNKQNLENLHMKHPRYCSCYAGVEEYLIPIIFDGIFLMYLHISGYRNNFEISKNRMNHITELCGERFAELYDSELSDVPPSLDTVLSFITPLEYMIVSLYNTCKKERDYFEMQNTSRNIYTQALQFIQDNYMHDISCSDISKKLQYSESYLRSVFKKEGNMSVQAKINSYRIDISKQMLKSTSMSITEIAFAVGYKDSNYFSSAFKKYIGISPLAYRKSV